MPLRHAVEACPPQELDLESGTGIPYLKMEDDAFEWDDAKAAENWRRHGVSFQQGAKALRDPFAVEWIDDREDYARVAAGAASGSQRCSTVRACQL